jgi:DNA-directed RNA polymerase specialized sigma24 family protein
MHFNEAIEQSLAQLAWRYGADLDALRSALSHESAEELAEVLGIEQPAAEERMARVRRCLSVQADWGAGCTLLTDDVQQDLLAAIAAW